MTIKPSAAQVLKLYTTHEHWLVCPMHVLWKFNSRACEKPECLKCIILGKRPPQAWRYTGMLARTSSQVDRFLSPSRFTAKMHADRGFSEPVRYFPYFIDRADQDWQNPAPRPQVEPYFLFVGRLEKIKGLQTLIENWKNVLDYDLLIVGAGNQAQELQTMAADNPRIKFLGPKSQRDLGNYYFHAQATLVPSITYETFGIIIVESFARKTPVIVRNLGALPEIVAESGGGFIFDTDEQLLSAITQLGESKALRDRLGEQGYTTFLRIWTREAHLEMYYKMLESLALEKFGSIPWN